MKKHILCSVVLCGAMGLTLAACGSQEGEQDGGSMVAVSSSEDISSSSTGENVLHEKAEEEWKAYEPKVRITDDGRQIRQAPYGNDPAGYGVGIYSSEWKYYNTYVLNADERGCDSCHDLREALDTIAHPYLYLGKYPSQDVSFSTSSTCTTCHTVESLKDFSHAHLQSSTFSDMGGSCISCHYIDDDGNYHQWDDVKYDVMRGITPVSVEELSADIEYNQDEITPEEYQFVESKLENGYSNEFIPRSDDVLDTYTVSFTGEMGNPREMTIQEMIDEFGTETRIEANHCVLEGTGENLIYQAEVKGVPVKRILETLNLKGSGDLVTMTGVDGFHNKISLDIFEDALLVYEMNGEPLPSDQGYPLVAWLGKGIGAGSNVRFLSEVAIERCEEGDAADYKGSRGLIYTNTETGEYINTPNIGVLTASSGQIFPAGEPVHLEGYAHAFVEEVTAIEFSFDGGQTWKKVDISDMDPSRWVYWKLDVNLEPGSYTMQMRATSVKEKGDTIMTGEVEVPTPETADPDGDETHTNAFMPKFLINVQ